MKKKKGLTISERKTINNVISLAGWTFVLIGLASYFLISADNVWLWFVIAGEAFFIIAMSSNLVLREAMYKEEKRKLIDDIEGVD